jgi:hypothetical protein
MRKLFTKSLLTAAVTAAIAMPVQAYNLHSSDAGELNLDVEAIFGAFSSSETYNTLGNPTGEKRDWQEAYIKAGFSGHRNLDNGSQVYGGINVLTGGTWGDGDAAGFSKGTERDTDLEDAFVGWRNDQIDFSLGRQNLSFGDGFLVNGDALNFGEGLGADYDRGGAYWLAARKAFDQTAVLRVGGEDGLRSDLFWIESDNPAQSSLEMAGINVEYISDVGTVGAMLLKGLDVNDTQAGVLGHTHRDGQDTFSLRYQGNAGVENLFLSAEFVTQDQGNNTKKDGDAWYVEAGWTFADVAWSPSVNYRYSTFDEGFDPLFFGFNRGYGTWFQGEVAANYAGPFNSDADVHHLAIKAAPSETLAVGALFFDFSNTNAGADTNDGQELDLYAEWVVNDNLIISPLVGFYTPDSSSSSQGNDDSNTYFQVLAIVPF